MLKKKLWIVALIAALAMVFAGCGGGGGGNEGEPEGESDFEITLGDNFQYGHGYQTGVDGGSPHIKVLDYITGTVTPGDEFTIKFTVVADRDLENPLDFGLVDPSAAASYWRKLTDAYTAGPAEDKTTTPPTPPAAWLKAGEEAVVDLVVKAIAAPAGDATDNLKFYFQTSGKCDKEGCGTAAGCDWTVAANNLNGGLEGPVTLTFTGFVFERKGEAKGPCCEDCENCDSKVNFPDGCPDCTYGDCTGDCGEEDGCCIPPPPPEFKGTKAVIKLGTVSQDIEIELTLPAAIEAEPEYLDDNSGYVTYSSGYGSAYAQFEVDFGAGNSLDNFSKVTFTVDAISGDTGTKGVGIAASSTKFVGYLGMAGDSPNANVLGTVNYSGDMKDRSLTITFSKSAPATQKVWIAIGVHAGTAVYTISNIVFVPKGEGPAIECDCCEDTGTCLDADACDGDCCCDDCLGTCAGCEEESGDVAVEFVSATANGNATTTTTALTLTFDVEIPGLAVTDITLGGASSGITITAVNGAGPVYTLPITGVSANGTVTVTVAKEGFEIEPATKGGISIYFYTAPSIECDCCEDTGTCLDADTCDGDCCCDDCLGTCAGCEGDAAVCECEDSVGGSANCALYGKTVAEATDEEIFCDCDDFGAGCDCEVCIEVGEATGSDDAECDCEDSVGGSANCALFGKTVAEATDEGLFCDCDDFGAGCDCEVCVEVGEATGSDDAECDCEDSVGGSANCALFGKTVAEATDEEIFCDCDDLDSGCDCEVCLEIGAEI